MLKKLLLHWSDQCFTFQSSAEKTQPNQEAEELPEGPAAPLPLPQGDWAQAPSSRPLSKFKERRKTAFSYRFAFISTLSPL